MSHVDIFGHGEISQGNCGFILKEDMSNGGWRNIPILIGIENDSQLFPICALIGLNAYFQETTNGEGSFIKRQ